MESLNWIASEAESLSFGQKAAGLGALFLLFVLGRKYYHRRKHWVDVPVVGASGFLTSYIAGLRFISTGQSLVEEGYKKYKGGVFQAAERNDWHVIVTTPQQIDELRKLPDDALDADIAADEHLKADYTMGPEIVSNPYHVAALKNFNKDLSHHFLELVDEMKQAFPVYFPPTTDWTPIKLFQTSLPLVCRTSNRTFIGDVCRHPEWIDVNIKYTMDVVIGAQIISLFPNFLQPFVGKYLTTAPRRKRQGAKVLVPVIKQRYELLASEGKEALPKDYLTHLIEMATGEERDPTKMTLRVLALNVAAIHTSSLALTRTLFRLAANPEYIQPLREEIIRVISEYGWTKEAMNNLVKMDSFVREGLRFAPGAVVNIDRRTRRDITLSSGTILPKGTFVSTAVGPIMRDPSNFGPGAEEFDGFRFSKLREEKGEDHKHQIVQIGPEFLAFGMGKRACPGRFLAAAEIKAMLSYVLLNYEFKFPDGLYKHGEVPPETWFGTVSAPSGNVELLFKKRESPI